MLGRRESPHEPGDRLIGELVQGRDVRRWRRRATVEASEGTLEAGLCRSVETSRPLSCALEQAPALSPRGLDQRLCLELGSLDRACGLPLGREYPVDRLGDLSVG
jgi:hypothetical protein